MPGGGVIALDLATLLGFTVGRLPPRPLTQLEAAVLKPPKPLSGVHRIAPPGTPVGPFLLAYLRWLVGMVFEHEPDGMIYEKPILPSKTTPQTVEKLVGLAGITQMVAADHKIRWVRSAQPSTVKLHICGNGGPGKDGVQAAIIARGWAFIDDNEADALALHDYAGHLYARERAR